jgi:hypothetical protein
MSVIVNPALRGVISDAPGVVIRLIVAICLAGKKILIVKIATVTRIRGKLNLGAVKPLRLIVLALSVVMALN